MRSKKTPLVSIIMNCYNGDKYLRKSIKSIISQSYKNWELIFWDNMSEDNSRNILKSFEDKRIFYFRSKKFLKLYHARNLALKKTKGKYVCFLDVDDYWTSDKLKKQIEYMIKNQQYLIIYTNHYVINEKKKKTYMRYKLGSLPSGYIAQKLLNDYRVGFITTMMKKALFKKYKFKQKYDIIGDFDFIINISLKYQVGCIQKPLAYYRLHDYNYSKKIQIHINELSNWIFVNKNLMNRFSLSLSRVRRFILKLKIKNFLNSLGV